MPAAVALAQALVSALLMNVCIVGLNQLYDVEIDKVNKPYLPLASGEMTMRQARPAAYPDDRQACVLERRGTHACRHLESTLGARGGFYLLCQLQGCAFVLALCRLHPMFNNLTAYVNRNDVLQGQWVVAVSGAMALALGVVSQSTPLIATLAGSLALGIVYSIELPFLRWKRHPVLAAACILAVRCAPSQSQPHIMLCTLGLLCCSAVHMTHSAAHAPSTTPSATNRLSS